MLALAVIAVASKQCPVKFGIGRWKACGLTVSNSLLNTTRTRHADFKKLAHDPNRIAALAISPLGDKIFESADGGSIATASASKVDPRSLVVKSYEQVNLLLDTICF